jgi:4-diphosphocytidyl-2-C-methyl-D-erythritol kinase
VSATAHPTEVRVRVPAKVNLHLGVGELRPDGYHELINVFHAVDLYDEVTVRPSVGLTIRMTGEGADALPTGPDNLAWRAASRLAAHHGVPADAAIEIAKAIPVAGGMAGGSADAAGTLLACARLWGVDDAALPHLAAELGSDVAFPLLGGTAVGVGRGERLDPLPAPATLHWVFALADFGISSGAAYRELDRMRADGHAPPPIGPPDALRAALRDGDVRPIAAALHNELQPACLRLAPGLRETLDAGLRLSALAAVVSGSGPTCAFLCADADAADTLAAELAAEGVCRATRAASGPVPGATVLDG